MFITLTIYNAYRERKCLDILDVMVDMVRTFGRQGAENVNLWWKDRELLVRSLGRHDHREHFGARLEEYTGARDVEQYGTRELEQAGADSWQDLGTSHRYNRRAIGHED